GRGDERVVEADHGAGGRVERERIGQGVGAGDLEVAPGRGGRRALERRVRERDVGGRGADAARGRERDGHVEARGRGGCLRRGDAEAEERRDGHCQKLLFHVHSLCWFGWLPSSGIVESNLGRHWDGFFTTNRLATRDNAHFLQCFQVVRARVCDKCNDPAEPPSPGNIVEITIFPPIFQQAGAFNRNSCDEPATDQRGRFASMRAREMDCWGERVGNVSPGPNQRASTISWSTSVISPPAYSAVKAIMSECGNGHDW